jgi:biopolymer transport protein ExbB
MRASFAVALSASLLAADALAAPAGSLDDLLQQVQGGYRKEKEEIDKRVAEFAAARDRQKALLDKASAELAALEKQGAAYEKEFAENERLLAEKEEELRARLGNMGELFGVIRQVAGDTRAQIQSSVVSAQYPGRGEVVAPLAESDSLPSVEQLEKLWFMLQQEMTESGKITRFTAPVVLANGTEQQQEIIRIGAFNVAANGRYLEWLPEVGKLTELPRQPPDYVLGQLASFSSAESGLNKVAIDPSRGRILSLLMETPTVQERIDQGGVIGYITIVIGIVALLIGLLRLLHLTFVNAKVKAQTKSTTPSSKNPLGRIMSVYGAHSSVDPETLEKKMDEAIIRETSRLESMLWLVKVVSVAAPLLGLLGTVTGMIQTFQAITLFGTGDPKLMAGGISEALVTTMIGLFVAIPLVLLYAALSSTVRRITDVLDEQSAGLVAVAAEKARASGNLEQ